MLFFLGKAGEVFMYLARCCWLYYCTWVMLLLLLLLLVYLIDNADLLLLRFFRDTLDVADIFYFLFFCENGR